ncbi:MerC domain-containing protein [Croceicoccus naphthovorans]|uniref:Uncharacterized protein n=1 Tax=Croceicoccus naphthovorans TaxID=1348774 RepID=A0A0G3XEP4_9SPHN|nr:MerC domain-containing protein [Croceicoccus naphthovorans]AKM09096.1 hypothetical protein AB433_02550 [Croceicoccus naphthovorans]MBB3991661.1 uncharacterized membrane protein (UPF0136 family) [Croceicoccus naphthovorans]
MIKNRQRSYARSSITNRTANWLDSFAVCASAVCMMHCLALPVLLAALPAIASRIDPGENFHVVVLVFAVPTSAMALYGGWRRHRSIVPLVVGVLGLILMTAAIALHADEDSETAITVSGSLLLAMAHIANWLHRHRPRT